MRLRWGSAGVTLMLELLLGFTLLVVAVFALFAVFPSGDKAVVRSVRMSQAGEIARRLLEEESNKNYSSLVDGLVTGQMSSGGLARGGQDLVTEFFYEVEVRQPDPDRKYRDIRVEVYWEEGFQKRKHGCELETSKGELI
jgi:hypothetical protein